MTSADIPPRDFTMSRLLYEQTLAATETVSENLTMYTRNALSILSFAGASGFNSAETRLLTASDQPVYLPRLATSDTEGLQTYHRFSVNLSQRENESLHAFSAKFGLPEVERIRRALRLRNFLVGYCGIQHPTLQHRDETPVTLFI